MTITLEPQPAVDLPADDLESVEPTPERPDLQRLAALLAESYIVLPLFA
jgi:hypothetical protein